MPAIDATRHGQHRRSTAPAWFALPLKPESLARYGRSLGLERPETALRALAEAIAGNAGWPAGATIVCRASPRPLMAVWGRFSAGEEGALEAQAGVLDSVCRHLRYVGYDQAAETTERLAARLLEVLGRDQIGRARFIAVPRGGLVVLGLLAVILGLDPEQLEPGAPEELLVVVDDCALSGARSARALELNGGRQVVFAHLYSHRRLRSAIEEREPRVLACVAGRELAEREDERRRADWRRRWSERGADRSYWIGRPVPLCFPWGEPDRAVWNAIRKRVERAWRVVPPDLCLKNRPPADALPARVQVLPESCGPLRPADQVLFGELEGSIVLGDFASGQSFMLQGVAADIWRLLARRGEIPEVAADLAREYEAPADTLLRDVRTFVARLIDQGLLRRVDPAPAATA